MTFIPLVAGCAPWLRVADSKTDEHSNRKRGHRLILRIMVALIFGLVAESVLAQVRFGIEENTDRFGNDYAVFLQANAAACAALCAANSVCQAYTFLIPATAGQRSSCWLKRAKGTPSDNPCCISGARGDTPTFSIVTVNFANVNNILLPGGSYLSWTDRIDRLAIQIASTGGAPDVISVTESTGWWSCLFPTPQTPQSVGDYGFQDLLIDNLARRTGVTYRIAYMVGNWGVTSSNCQFFKGDTVLYNPRRIVNQNSLGSAVSVAHDLDVLGFQRRRSLPLCNRQFPPLRPLQSLIDGAPQTDKCGATPSGLAWTWVADEIQTKAVVASLARFSFLHDQRTSFDVFTIHPGAGDEAAERADIVNFIAGMSSSPLRTIPTTLPPIVVGDFNALVASTLGTALVPGFSVVSIAPAHDQMDVQVGNTSAAAQQYSPTVRRSFVLPLQGAGNPDYLFSDHSGLRVEFEDANFVFETPPPPIEGLRLRDPTPTPRPRVPVRVPH